MYSNLRFVLSTALVGCAGLIGVLTLLPPTLEDRLLASEQLSDPPAPACNQQTWLHFDRNCLSRRGMPWVADLPSPKAAPSPVESAPEQPSDTQAAASAAGSTEAAVSTDASASTQAASRQVSSSQSSVPAAPEPAKPVDISASRQETAIAEEPQVATQQSEATTPQEEASAPPVATERRAVKQRNATRPRHAAPVTTERNVAKPAVETKPPAPKKAAREDRGAKQTNEALNAVRRFQDNLRDIPVSSYAADGTRRTIVIRPTSIQDVNYYSAPR